MGLYNTSDFWSRCTGAHCSGPYAIHPYEQLYSLTRVFTLITLILNMLAFDSSSPINCQVCISPITSFARAKRKLLGKVMGYL